MYSRTCVLWGNVKKKKERNPVRYGCVLIYHQNSWAVDKKIVCSRTFRAKSFFLFIRKKSREKKPNPPVRPPHPEFDIHVIKVVEILSSDSFGDKNLWTSLNLSWSFFFKFFWEILPARINRWQEGDLKVKSPNKK